MSAVVTDSVRGPVIDVVIESDLWDAAPDAEAVVRRAVVNAADAIGASTEGRELAVLLTDDAAIRRLNAQWRGLDKPTNVLSFPPARLLPAAQRAALGDIAIAYETTAREAEADDKPFPDHLAHLAVHGFLHLLGYDHESDAQAETMEALERAILERLGVPDPYRTHEIGV